MKTEPLGLAAFFIVLMMLLLAVTNTFFYFGKIDFIYLPSGILVMILSTVSLYRIKKSGNFDGKGFPIAAVILLTLAVLFVIFMTFFFRIA